MCIIEKFKMEDLNDPTFRLTTPDNSTDVIEILHELRDSLVESPRWKDQGSPEPIVTSGTKTVSVSLLGNLPTEFSNIDAIAPVL